MIQMSLRSFLHVDPKSPFSLANIPFGIVSSSSNPHKRAATILGNWVIDLAQLASAGLLKNVQGLENPEIVFSKSDLNCFAALGRFTISRTRERLQELLSESCETLKNNDYLRKCALISDKDVTCHLPMSIGDYTDFYTCRNHAFNASKAMRGENASLPPAFLRLPIAYHGRASSIVSSGTSIRRPLGQTSTGGEPSFGPCTKMDYEAEMGFFVCKPNTLGERVAINEAEDHIFGAVLLNDWSARDIQSFEYFPLGPFNGKNFATSISPWIVTLDALEPFKCALPEHDYADPEYLCMSRKAGYNVNIQIDLRVSGSEDTATIGQTNLKHLYWSAAQMLTHHTVGGCNLRTGDLLGTGTISGDSNDKLGCFLELSRNGKQSVKITGSAARTWLEDGDEIIMTAWAGKDSARVGFGECRGVILPATKF
ncbi:Fumarylacetoacetase [Neolecta irregularis DAH-3]|uniref:Fumarylacetoacetase n=1 Tax=Neolecta irregularis (strain DAH-3) TaxID=1198029 RepID=A0A1U7LQQ6_NEOID|nr:Fumarylacetoacetase [Neolecta irregularis DAH-3]|eukprot:OLL24974.1 Fumarylacetoacetase [Neolecta irregularis DAH-3]